MRAARLGAGLAATAVAVRLVTGPGLVNYDTLYALVWGRDLASGTLVGPRIADTECRQRAYSRF